MKRISLQNMPGTSCGLSVTLTAGLFGIAVALAGPTWADEFGYEGAPADAATDTVPTTERSEVVGFVQPRAIYVDGADGKTGEYSGLQSDGVLGAIDFEAVNQPDGRSGETRYWKAWGRNLGTGTGDLELEVGDRGDYKIRLGFGQIEHVDRDDASTLFRGGDNHLTLPAGYTAPADAADRSIYRNVDLGVKREELSLYVEKALDSNWTLISDLRQENKHGDKPTAVGQGFRGSVIGIQSIDYQHTQLDLRLRLADPGKQLEFGYYFSHFDNDDSALTFDNPLFAAAGTQQLALPPENFLHQISVNGGFRLNEKSRVTAHGAFSRATQNENFLPYSIDSVSFYDYGGAEPPLPRKSLDGKVDQMHFNFSLLSRRSAKLRTELGYRFEDRDNKTPNEEYRHLHYNGDADEEWANRVNSRTRHTFSAEAKLRLPKRMRLNGGYEHQRTIRETSLLVAHVHHDDDPDDPGAGLGDIPSTLTTRDHVTREDTVWTQLKAPISERLSAKLKISGSKRNVKSSPGFDEHIDEHDAVAPMYLLDRDRIAVNASANWQACDDKLVSFSWQGAREDFTNSAFGPEQLTSQSANLDLAYTPTGEISGHAFLGVEVSESSQNSRGTGGDRGATVSVSDRWSVDIEDLAYHAGLGVDWKPAHERFNLGLDYSFIDSENAVSSQHEADGSDHLPNTDVRIHRVGLEAEVPLEKQLTLTTGYRYQRYDSENWSWSMDNYDVLGFGWDNPNANSHVLMMGLRFDF